METAALQYGIDRGLTVIDPAEMYADGQPEVVVGKTIADRRSQVFLVSKVWPSHQSPPDLPQSLPATLRRLNTASLDPYLLHWPSQQHRLEDIALALAKIQQQGLSNYPWQHWQGIQQRMPFSTMVPVNQVEYDLLNRRAEHHLIPQAKKHGLALMAYFPVKGVLALHPFSPQSAVLQQVATAHRTHPATIAFGYVIDSGPVLAIPKALQHDHIDRNAAARDLDLSDDERRVLQEAFPGPAEDIPYEAL